MEQSLEVGPVERYVPGLTRAEDETSRNEEQKRSVLRSWRCFAKDFGDSETYSTCQESATANKTTVSDLTWSISSL